ncbi:ABC transporter ATP-binding protein [soil metagenome]
MNKGNLELDKVVAGYGAEPVLKGVDFSTSGELLAVLGPNGAGKSTLLRTIVGLVRPTSGDIRLGQRSVVRLDVERRARAGIALVPEGRRLFGTLTVLENLASGAFTGRSGMPVDDVFSVFPRLADRRQSQARFLSGGEQQMLAIGRALVGGPHVLLVDEPSLGLAPQMVEAVLDAFRELVATGLTVVLGEQNVSAAVTVATRCILLDTGAVIADIDSRTEDGRSAVMKRYAESIALTDAVR